MLRRTFLPLAAASILHAEPVRRLPADNLLLYGDGKPVRGVRDWQIRRAQILDAMQQIMGPLPGRQKHCPLDLQVEEEADAGTYVRRLVSYASEPGSRVPAYLLVPKSALAGKPARAALALHPTDDKAGHKVVVGLGGRANRQYASELAERGWVVLAPGYPLLANYQPDWRSLGYRSGTMKAIHDNRRGIDLLETLPYVRRGGVASIGHSLGGHNSVYTAVFEPRIRAVVSSCGLDAYTDYMGGNIRGWTSDRYMPALKAYEGRPQEIPFDFQELIGALAPRPVLIVAPRRDSNFRWQSVDRVVAAARPVYRLHGRTDDLQVEHPDCEHDFPDGMRELAYQFLSAPRK